EEVGRAWLAYLEHESGGAQNARDAYAGDLRQFFGWLRTELGRAPCLADVAELDAKRFRAFLAARRRRPVVSRSLARTMSALRTFLRWLDETDSASNAGLREGGHPPQTHGAPR